MLDWTAGFRVFDRDNDGFITLEELRETMWGLGEKLTDPELLEMIEDADVDGDGKISYSEYVKKMLEGEVETRH